MLGVGFHKARKKPPLRAGTQLIPIASGKMFRTHLILLRQNPEFSHYFKAGTQYMTLFQIPDTVTVTARSAPQSNLADISSFKISAIPPDYSESLASWIRDPMASSRTDMSKDGFATAPVLELCEPIKSNCIKWTKSLQLLQQYR